MSEELPLKRRKLDNEVVLSSGKDDVKVKSSSFLPRWVRDFVPIGGVDEEEDDKVGHEETKGILGEEIWGIIQSRLNISRLFPFQRRVHSAISHPFGGDIAVCAPTGSGKTLSYVLPICMKISKSALKQRHYLQCIVVLPTRELADQVGDVFTTVGSPLSIRVIVLGKKSISTSRVSDIVIGTPGKVVDAIENGLLCFERIQFVVIDEADRIMQQTYSDCIRSIHSVIEKDRGEFLRQMKQILSDLLMEKCHSSLTSSSFCSVKSLVFSATLTRNPTKLAALCLSNNPTFFSTSASMSDVETRFVIPNSLSQYMVISRRGDEDKPFLLVHLLRNDLSGMRVICFVSSIDTAHRLSTLMRLMLEDQVEVYEFSRQLPQSKRKKILKRLKNAPKDNKCVLVVCSDAMSRGLDVDGLEAVVSYDCPANIKTYVHRVGRTARAGNVGSAFTILRSKDVKHFRKILRKAEFGDNIRKFKAPDEDTLEKLYGEKIRESLNNMKFHYSEK